MTRVLVVLSEMLISVGAESLLLNEQDLNVISSPLANEIHLREQILRFQPEVLVMDASLSIEELLKLRVLLRDYPKLRFVVIDEHGNRAAIYDKHEILINKASDLIAAVR